MLLLSDPNQISHPPLLSFLSLALLFSESYPLLFFYPLKSYLIEPNLLTSLFLFLFPKPEPRTPPQCGSKINVNPPLRNRISNLIRERAGYGVTRNPHQPLTSEICPLTWIVIIHIESMMRPELDLGWGWSHMRTGTEHKKEEEEEEEGGPNCNSTTNIGIVGLDPPKSGRDKYLFNELRIRLRPRHNV